MSGVGEVIIVDFAIPVCAVPFTNVYTIPKIDPWKTLEDPDTVVTRLKPHPCLEVSACAMMQLNGLDRAETFARYASKTLYINTVITN